MIPWKNRKDKSLFVKYSVFAWGVVASVFTVTVTLQCLPEGTLPDYVIRPAIGYTRCFIIGKDNIELKWLLFNLFNYRLEINEISRFLN